MTDKEYKRMLFWHNVREDIEGAILYALAGVIISAPWWIQIVLLRLAE